MMNGKTFIQKMVGAILIVLTVSSFLRCSSSNDGEDEVLTPDANCASVENGMAVSIANNHGHSMTVSKADIVAGTEKTYNIKGSANHTQYITVSAADFNFLKNNSSISVLSTATEAGENIMHFHRVRVFCE